MSIWDTYENRMNVKGSDIRETFLNREKKYVRDKTVNSLSYFTVKIDGVDQSVSIINSDNLNEKTMCSLPGEDFNCGSLVEWADNHWLITEKDANGEIYSKGKLIQCNHLLHWIDCRGELHQQWCIIEDGTKYLTGIYGDRNFIVDRGDSRIAMTIGKNEHTLQFGRESRFLIDDPDSFEKLAYLLTKPLKVGKTYNGSGIYAFVLQEVVSTEDDNMALGIADYYKYYPKETTVDNCPKIRIDPDNQTTETGKKVWL